MPTLSDSADAPAETGAAAQPRAARILVADDEYLVALDIVSQLAACGYTAIGPAGSGNEALRLARAQRPDLALLDVRMPDGDGITTARAIADELNIPVVMLSAYTDEQTVVDARDAGVYAYLAKPARSQQLRAAIEVALSRHRDMDANRADAVESRRLLEERRIVERAKWTLVQRAGVTEPEAMRLLEKYARDRGERLIDVAERVIRTGAAFGDADN